MTLKQDNLETYQLLSDILNGVKDYSRTDPHIAFGEAETIISCLSHLTDPLLRMEQAYRELVVSYLDDGKSKAESEARAKASEEYRKWQKLKLMCELANEHIMLLKKFKDQLDVERGTY